MNLWCFAEVSDEHEQCSLWLLFERILARLVRLRHLYRVSRIRSIGMPTGVDRSSQAGYRRVRIRVACFRSRRASADNQRLYGGFSKRSHGFQTVKASYEHISVRVASHLNRCFLSFV